MKFQDKLEKQPGQTVKITVTLPWKEILAEKEKALEALAKETEVKGFRKGKAPIKLVREQLGEGHLLEEATKHFLNDVYHELLTKHNLRPFAEPRVQLQSAETDKDWVVEFLIAEEPQLRKLPDYKKIAEKVKAESKKDAIWVPGKDKEQKPEDLEKVKSERLQKIFNELVQQTELELSPLIIDEEVNRRLVNTYEEIKKMGLSIEQYMQAKKETAESMREKAKVEVLDIYKAEYVLQKIANEEKIVVEDKDMEPLMKTAKDDKQRDALKQNMYMYTQLIRKQKTLDFLAGL